MRGAMLLAALAMAALSGRAADRVKTPTPAGTDAYARVEAAVKELGAKFPGYPAAQFLAELAARRAKGPAGADLQQLLQKMLVRENPLVNAQEILYTTHPMWRGDHHNTATLFQCGEINEKSYVTQGALKALDVKTGRVRDIVPEVQGRTIRDPEVDWDGTRVVFAMRKGRDDDYHIYTVNTDGTDLKQLTFAKGVSDIDPAWLPDGRIVFSSTREPKYCMCNRHIMANLYRMEADGANIHQIGKSTLFEGHASVLADGRVLYDRWEYVDRNFGDAQGLWVCNPDGTRHALYWGNNTTSPGAVINARGLSSVSKVIAVLGSCHDRPWGALGLIDRAKGVDGRTPVVRTWPAEFINRIHDGGRKDCDSTMGIVRKFADPFPLDDEHFLCVRQTGKGKPLGIVYFDLHGNMVTFHTDGTGCHSPMPIRSAKKPVVASEQRNFESPNAKGSFYVQNVYVGTHMQGVKPGSIKALRIVESPEKRTWTLPLSWSGRGLQAAAMNWLSFENKRILGTVPVEADGSAYFEVPGNTFVYFQALDEEGKMVQSMRSGAYVQPGERYGCVGCHENRVGDVPKPEKQPLALARAPSKLDGSYNLRGLERGTPAHLYSFQKEVQPVFDRACVKCHDYGKPAGEKLNLAGDLGAYFCTSYVDIWVKGYVQCIGAGPAQTQPACSWGARASKLTKMLDGHGGVKLTADERDRVITWMDINAPYWPCYECAWPENYGGRMPITCAEFKRLGEITGVQVARKSGAGQREQLNFTRPEKARILDAVRAKPAAYAEALAILQAGKERLKTTPRADMDGFVPCADDRAREVRYQRRLAEERAVYEAIRTGKKRYDARVLAPTCGCGQAAAPTDKGTLKAYSMVTRDGRRMVSWTKGGRTTYELVPTNQLPANLPPVREWKLYCVRSTHTDIGLHNSQYVQRHGSVTRTDLARRLVAAEPDDANVAAFRYTLEGYWFFHNYPLDRGEAATRALIADEMRRGRIGTTAACAGNHTHLYGYEELCRSIYTRKIYVEKWGLNPKTLLMADNPGISWSVVQPYAEAGVENVLFLPNQWNPLLSTIWPQNKKIPYANWNPDAGGGGSRVDVRWDSPLPMLFWWQAPDGVSKLLFWAGTQYSFGGQAFGISNRKQQPSVKKMEEALPRQLAKMDARYPYDVWLFANYSDDEKPGTWVSNLFKRWNAKWRWPEFRTIGNPDEVFDAVKAKWGEQIPVLSGEIVSGWLQHAASTPELLARKQVADRELAATEAESSIAAATKDTPYPAEDFRRAWWALILNDEHSYGTSGYKGRRVFETWLQHRDWIEKAERLNPEKAKRTVSNPSAGVQENAWYKIVVNEQGELTSIYDKELGRELLDGVANRFLYTRDNHRTWETNPVQALGAELVQTVTLDPNEKKIYIDNAFTHARDLFNDKRYYRYGYYAFPFAVSNGVFQAQLNGPVMRPYVDLTGHCTDAYVGVRDWCAVENGDFGVALMQVDSSLVEFGEIHPDKTCYSFGKPPAGKSALYSYVFTDWLQMHNPDGESFNPRFRYVITSYKGSWKDAHLPATVERTLNPQLASVAAAHVHAEAPNVLLVALKAAEDGNGYIARFREAEGRATRTKVVQTFLPGATVTQVGLLETPRAGVGTVPNELVLAPYAYGTVRIADGRKVVCAPPTADGYVYTELVTRPRATHGEKPGQLYLEWGLDPSPAFDHFELWRDGAFVANVKPEVHEGLAYRVNRYEDLGLKEHTRYTYTIRPVSKNGGKGPFSKPFTGLTRQSR